jgi:hypothetical protein
MCYIIYLYISKTYASDRPESISTDLKFIVVTTPTGGGSSFRSGGGRRRCVVVYVGDERVFLYFLLDALLIASTLMNEDSIVYRSWMAGSLAPAWPLSRENSL